ncbi:MAG TPA: ATP-grasp domain-containing protein [Thermoanaerobaculia bacterium]|jgi:D-alanine-D-alanine ligase|nr:ATP-grasp domain-containing protein [Thermoanaerobaculia bacterium]
MKITVLTGLEKPDPKSYDVVADQVAAALTKKGHKTSILGVYDDVSKLVSGISRRKPDLIFNLLESFGGKSTAGDFAIAGVLDLLGVRYTGGGPGELYLRQDKGLAKKVLAFEKIPYPHFAVFSQTSDFETAGNLRMPLFVKPLTADASIGIDGDSLVRDTTSLMKRVIAIHEKIKDSALVEEYIEGRELYVGVLGNREPLALPPVEVDFTGFPEGEPRILGTKAKWKKNSAEYKGTKSVMADLPDELRARLQKTAIEAYRAVRVRDYGRVDLRLTETGDIYVIEVNASCYLEKDSEFSMAAQAGGIEFPDLVERIVELAVERYG